MSMKRTSPQHKDMPDYTKADVLSFLGRLRLLRTQVFYRALRSAEYRRASAVKKSISNVSSDRI